MSKVGQKIDLKIVILGSGGVGKTSFIHRYIHDEFGQTLSTVGASFVLKAWKNFNFGIWDTAGQEKFARISSYYTRGAQGAILAYDITDLESFQLLANYVEFLKGASKDCWIVVIGTKLDLAEEDPSTRQVATEMGKAFAQQLSAPFYETSSKLDTNISIVFDNIGYHCLADKLVSESTQPVKVVPNTQQSPKPPLAEDLKSPPAAKSGSCCSSCCVS